MSVRKTYTHHGPCDWYRCFDFRTTFNSLYLFSRISSARVDFFCGPPGHLFLVDYHLKLFPPYTAQCSLLLTSWTSSPR